MSALKAKTLEWELRNEGQSFAEYRTTNVKGIVLSIVPKKSLGGDILFHFQVNGLPSGTHHTLESAKEAAQLYADRMVRAFTE